MMKSGKRIEKFIAKCALRATETNVNSACICFTYQAKLPEKSLILKKR